MKRLYLCILAITGLAAGCSAGPGPGLTSQGLPPCPDRPNCVSSQSQDKQHQIAAISYEGSRKQALDRISAIISSLPRTKIITQTPDYIHAEFRSKWLRFVDDVAFWFPEGKDLIHIRSASRLGYSDLGVNRERMETIRELFKTQTP